MLVSYVAVEQIAGGKKNKEQEKKKGCTCQEKRKLSQRLFKERLRLTFWVKNS